MIKSYHSLRSIVRFPNLGGPSAPRSRLKFGPFAVNESTSMSLSSASSLLSLSSSSCSSSSSSSSSSSTGWIIEIRSQIKVVIISHHHIKIKKDSSVQCSNTILKILGKIPIGSLGKIHTNVIFLLRFLMDDKRLKMDRRVVNYLRWCLADREYVIIFSRDTVQLH